MSLEDTCQPNEFGPQKCPPHLELGSTKRFTPLLNSDKKIFFSPGTPLLPKKNDLPFTEMPNKSPWTKLKFSFPQDQSEYVSVTGSDPSSQRETIKFLIICEIINQVTNFAMTNKIMTNSF
jgi:hypothetical protein